MSMKRLKLSLALAAISVLAFGNAAQAATTVDATATGTNTSVSAIASGDVVDVTNTAALPATGISSVALNSTWNNDALQLNSGSPITYPEGWSLEYTTDGTTWSSTPPNPLSLAVGVRSVGSMESNSNGFVTHPSSNLLQSASSFTGSTGGDGYDLTFVEDRVFNQFHHSTSIFLKCHLKADGTVCPGLTVAGYQTPNGASSFYNPTTKKLYVVSMQTLTHDFGFACINLANLASPAVCATPFVDLFHGNGNSDAYRENIGSSSQDATKHVWVFNGANYSLMCLDMNTGAACATGNGQALANTGLLAAGGSVTGSPSPLGLSNSGRVSAIGGKVYYVSDTKFGCYDPSANPPALCGAGVTVALADQYPPFPIRDSSGSLTGVCLYVSRICISSTEANVTVPPVLLTLEQTHSLPAWNTFNAGQWAEVDNKLFLNKGPNATASADVYCYDFTTAAACSGFSGAGVGSQIYAIITDPTMPSCLWTNGNAGVITSFSANTGTAGCATANPVARMPYSAVAPRLSCSEAGRVTTWSSVHFNFGSQTTVTRSNLRVTVYDASGSSLVAIPGFNSVSIDSTNTLDLSTITSVTRATIEITAGAVPSADLLAVTADVQYTGQAPQVCYSLLAKEVCANNYVHLSGDASVANGVIQASTVVTPNGGGSATTDSATKNLAGTYTNTVCAYPGGTQPPAPSVSLTKTQTSPDPTYPGDVVQYSLVATNNGNLPITGLVITDENATVGNCVSSGSSATLAVGDRLSCTASHTVTLAEVLAGYVSNTAKATAGQSVNETSNTVFTSIKNAPSMTVVKKQISADPKAIGDLVRYDIKVTNTGNTILSNVMVTDVNAEIDYCDPMVPVTQLKIGASIDCRATHKVSAADVAAGQIVNVAVAKSDDVIASSAGTTTPSNPGVASGPAGSAGNSLGRIHSNEVVTHIAGTKGASTAPKPTSGANSGKPGKKPSGQLAFTGDQPNQVPYSGLLLLAIGSVLLVGKRARKIH